MIMTPGRPQENDGPLNTEPPSNVAAPSVSNSAAIMCARCGGVVWISGKLPGELSSKLMYWLEHLHGLCPECYAVDKARGE